jgi:hypothetical protein
MSNIACKVFGHKLSVIWIMDKSQATFCGRCGSWFPHTTINKGKAK